MINRYLIFGRPRSRTAWVANFLTTHGDMCLHEGLADCQGSYAKLAFKLGINRGGNADTGMIHSWQEALRVFPQAKLVVLTGTGLSWYTFALENKIPSSIVHRIDSAYRETKEALKGKAIFINALELTEDWETALRLHKHCLGQQIPCRRDRYDMLKDLNIQVQPGKLLARLGIERTPTR